MLSRNWRSRNEAMASGSGRPPSAMVSSAYRRDQYHTEYSSSQSHGESTEKSVGAGSKDQPEVIW